MPACAHLQSVFVFWGSMSVVLSLTMGRPFVMDQPRMALLQVFLDVVESVNLLVNSNGTVVRSEVVGALKMRTFLSGMPECKLGLNDKARAPPLPPAHSACWG